MAEDQSPKSTSIDDLVKELTQKSSSGTTSSPSPSQLPSLSSRLDSEPVNPITQDKNPFPAPRSSGPSLPLNPKTLPPNIPSPAPLMPSPKSPPLNPIKEYQSSIRTMFEDLSSLKQGQKPSGVEVPRKVEPQIQSEKSAILKPPAPEVKVPLIDLGKTEKSAPMKAMPIPPVPKPITPVSGSKAQISIPESKKGANNKVFIGIAGLIVIGGLVYWFFVLKNKNSEVVEELPSPIESVTPTVTPIQDLTSIFSNAIETSFSVDPDNLVKSFYDGLDAVVISGGELQKLRVIDTSSQDQRSLSLVDLVDKLAPNTPQQLKDSLGADYINLAYGQKESFNTKGQVDTSGQIKKRVVFIQELRDSNGFMNLLKSSEVTIGRDLEVILGHELKEATSKFLDNLYRTVAIRYKNFPYPDMTVDYTVIRAFNGKSYFILSNSRESMYAILDKLTGL